MKIYEHNDGQTIGKEHPQLLDFLSQACLLHPLSGSVRFCGMINVGDNLHFFWPKTFVRSARSKIDCGRSLLGAIAKYSKAKGKTMSSGLEDDGDIVGIPPATSLDLLEDYLRYGLYSNSTPEFNKQNTGKIAWGRVIKNTLPVKGYGGAPVYTDLVVRKLNYFADNEVSKIHAAVIARLDKVFGWYFTNNRRGIAPEHVEAKLAYSSHKAVSILKKELSLVFSDRETRLIRNLIEVIEKVFIARDSETMFTGIENFEHVWEEMCSFIFVNDADRFQDTIPVPAYVYDEKTVPSPPNRQRVDVIIEEADRIAVIDAKYYDMVYTKPGWSDLVKQFYYQKSLSAVTEARSIANFLVVPADQTDNLPSTVTVVDKDLNKLSADFPDIKIVYEDVGEVIDCYISNVPEERYRRGILSSF